MKQKVKRTGSWLLLVCLMIMLAACGQASNSDGKTASEEKESETVLFHAANGEVEIPKIQKELS